MSRGRRSEKAELAADAQDGRGWRPTHPDTLARFREGRGAKACLPAHAPLPSLNACGSAAGPRKAGQASVSVSKRLLYPRLFHPSAAFFFLLLSTVPSLSAAPVWTAPKELPFGTLGALELRESDPAKPAPPRPGEDRLGPLELRGAEALADGRGWRLTVQALRPGTLLIPAIDLGDGRRAPELRISVPRTTPYGAPWMAVGGGQEDLLPLAPFPWGWASLLLVPVLGLIWACLHLWRRGSSTRKLKRARASFRHHWPPPNWDRGVLDKAHARGRDLLAVRFGEEARCWGPVDFHRRHLGPWVRWAQGLDGARFADTRTPWPTLDELLKSLEAQ